MVYNNTVDEGVGAVDKAYTNKIKGTIASTNEQGGTNMANQYQYELFSWTVIFVAGECHLSHGQDLRALYDATPEVSYKAMPNTKTGNRRYIRMECMIIMLYMMAMYLKLGYALDADNGNSLDQNVMKKFHINVPKTMQPRSVSIMCQGKVADKKTLSPVREKLTYREYGE